MIRQGTGITFPPVYWTALVFRSTALQPFVLIDCPQSVLAHLRDLSIVGHRRYTTRLGNPIVFARYRATISASLN
jgi:hypothetical protein